MIRNALLIVFKVIAGVIFYLGKLEQFSEKEKSIEVWVEDENEIYLVMEILATFRYPSRNDKLAIKFMHLEFREVWASGITC